MTYVDIKDLIASIADAVGCGYHYYDEGERDIIKTPYLLFDYPDRNDMKADDRNFMKVQKLNIEYDSKGKDIDAESKIEEILEEADLTYTKEDTHYERQDAYGVMYSMEVVINARK